MKMSVLPVSSPVLIGFVLFFGAVTASNQTAVDDNDSPHNSSTHYNATAAHMLGGENGTMAWMDAPHLVLKNTFDQPCFLGIINATLRISYRVRPDAVQDTYIAITDVPFPESVDAMGECNMGTINVNYNWENSSLQVKLVFTEKEPSKKDVNGTANWSITDIEVHFDLGNEEVFPGARDAKPISVDRRDLDIFQTSIDNTLICENAIRVQVGHDEPSVEVIFNQVELAAFGVTSEEFPEEVVRCTDESSLRPEDDIVVPLIVACSLSAVVILVVVAYAISRKIQEVRDQSQYKPMP